MGDAPHWPAMSGGHGGRERSAVTLERAAATTTATTPTTSAANPVSRRFSTRRFPAEAGIRLSHLHCWAPAFAGERQPPPSSRLRALRQLLVTVPHHTPHCVVIGTALRQRCTRFANDTAGDQPSPPSSPRNPSCSSATRGLARSASATLRRISPTILT